MFLMAIFTKRTKTEKTDFCLFFLFFCFFYKMTRFIRAFRIQKKQNYIFKFVFLHKKKQYYENILTIKKGFTMNIIPEHPGVELKHLLQEKNMNISQFARTIGVSASRISEILSGKRRVTLDSAFKFSEAFNNSPEHWIRKQEDYDIFMKRYSE